MKCGGSVSAAVKKCGGGAMKKGGKYAEGGKADIAQDKAIVKKAFKLHDKQEHGGEKTDLSTLKKGGRSKKAVGTVKKYKAGGAIEMKKSSGDLDTIKKIKATGNKKADAPSKASTKPAFKGSDVEKEKSKPAGEKDTIKKVKPTGDKKADAPSKAASAPKNTPKKFAVGGITSPVTAGGMAMANPPPSGRLPTGGGGILPDGAIDVGAPPIDPNFKMYPTDPLPPNRGPYGQGGFSGRFGDNDGFGGKGRFMGGRGFDRDNSINTQWGGRDAQPIFPGKGVGGISIGGVQGMPMHAYADGGAVDPQKAVLLAKKITQTLPPEAIKQLHQQMQAGISNTPIMPQQKLAPNGMAPSRPKNQGPYSDAEINATLAEMAKRGDFSHTGD